MKIFDRQTATALVVANMIGTGIFSTLGIQMEKVTSPIVLLFLWLLGGVYAVSGAVIYSKLSKLYPRNGGEYHFLTKLIHPSLGWSAGIISIVTGFSAPIALTALASASYLQNVFNLDIGVVATILVLVISFIHIYRPQFGGRFHLTITVIKVFVLIGIVVIGFSFSNPTSSLNFDQLSIDGLGDVGYVLIITLFTYSGWNASCYVLEEVKDSEQNVKISLIAGSLIVTALYLFVNLVFMNNLSQQELSGSLDIGHLFFSSTLGGSWSVRLDFVIGFLLISSISAMVIAGGRVIKTMLEDHPIIKGSLFYSISAIALLSIMILNSFTFSQILIYTGFTLTILVSAISLGVCSHFIRGLIKLGKLEIICLLFFTTINTFLIIYFTVEEFSTSIISWSTIIILMLTYFIPSVNSGSLKLYERK